MASANDGLFVLVRAPDQGAQASIAFYSDVVGWRTQPFPEGVDYIMWVGGQGPLGGVMKLPDEAAKMGLPPHWIAYVQVEGRWVARPRGEGVASSRGRRRQAKRAATARLARGSPTGVSTSALKS